ncbi:MAG: CYTH domain-containing protein [Muribaculaceae bacterium]|nr:CYTH domain-containing protein [Muribaculaceae bacterium]
MALEIERKFLVINDIYRLMASKSYNIKQGYLSTRKDATVRVRIKNKNAFITVKGLNKGATRCEWEYSIPYDDAIEMMALSQGVVIDKIRYIVEYEGFIWEVDEFKGAHDGLVVAEIELKDENETFPIPPFIGEEVTGNVAYYNSTLAGV